jgi:DNA-binding transcriptional LysR family regulator
MILIVVELIFLIYVSGLLIVRLENGELRAFRAVIEEGGFKRAADALHISQSAVSQAVANLEGKLNTVLIARGKEPKLTPAGRRLFEHAVDVFAGEQHALEDITQLKEGRSETLSLAISASINRFYGPKLISAYYRLNPRCTMKIAEIPSRSMISAVLSGNTELGLGPFQKHMPAFDTVPLYSDSQHLVVSPKHPHYSAMIAGDRAALKRTALIASALDSPDMRPSIARLRDQFSSVWEVSSLNLRIHMVAQGMGASFFDRKLLQEHPLSQDFRIIDDVSFGRIDRQVGLYFRSGKNLSGSARQFIALCEDYWTLETKK